MRGILKPILHPILRRNPAEVERQARHFHIGSAEGRSLVAKVGDAFFRGYNTMLDASSAQDVSAQGQKVEPHFRPFFFEGAAMGYLPRSYFTAGAGRKTVERDLLAMNPRFRYLYYVGLGFWFGFRHRRKPAALEALAPDLTALYFPLCYDGFGFKVGFFDFPRRPSARDLLGRAPVERRAFLYQGFGRALFFVFLDDPAGFEREKAEAPEAHRDDIELGRSLAVAFTGTNRPDRILAYLAAARDARERAARLLGVTWALTAREMNDPEYFEECVGRASTGEQKLLRLLPALCREALGRSHSYAEWQGRTQAAAVEAYAGGTEVKER